MRELEHIYLAYETAKSNKLNCVLATVVHVEGSSYRRAGARMLVEELGQMTGAISGGCLEGDALKKSLHALHQNRNKLITYDTSDESDAIVGAQLGCNGIIQILFEPIDYNNPENPVELLKEVLQNNNNSVLVSLFNLQKNQVQIGTSLLFNIGGKTLGDGRSTEFLQKIKSDAKFAHSAHKSCFRTYRSKKGELQAFFQFVPQPIHLVIVGAGNDAQILASMADSLGWNISVIDGRATHANKERFLGSCQVVVTEPEKALEALDINDNTVFVLMTHNYKYDLAILELLLLRESLLYIGILGPKKKYKRMLEDMAEKGIHPSAEQKNRIYAPIGLDLNSETPAEIALSILSEIQKVLCDSSADHLRDKLNRIHVDEPSEFQLVQLENQ